MNNKYILNANKSKKDKRDYIYEKMFKINNVPNCDYRNELLPIRNQGSQGTCYAQSVACMKEWQEFKDIDLNNRNFTSIKKIASVISKYQKDIRKK